MRTKTTHQADKMLDAAARLFGTQHFHEVRMEDIAAEAEVGKATLYRYFMDKEELYLALLRRESEQFLARLEKSVSQATGPRQRLEAIVAGILDYFDEQPHLLDLMQRTEVLCPPGTELPWRKTLDDLVRLLAELFAAGQQAGEFCVRDPELGILMLLGGLRSVIRFGGRPRPSDLPRRIVANFLRGADPL
jgi:AcrR family transcriptional regulator